jgi:hypothetical protein
MDHESPSLGRGVAWGVIVGAVVAIFGTAAGEPAGTVLAFSLPTALIAGVLAYLPSKPRPVVEGDPTPWVRLLLRILFRMRGRP